MRIEHDEFFVALQDQAYIVNDNLQFAKVLSLYRVSHRRVMSIVSWLAWLSMQRIVFRIRPGTLKCFVDSKNANYQPLALIVT